MALYLRESDQGGDLAFGAENGRGGGGEEEEEGFSSAPSLQTVD